MRRPRARRTRRAPRAAERVTRRRDACDGAMTRTPAGPAPGRPAMRTDPRRERAGTVPPPPHRPRGGRARGAGRGAAAATSRTPRWKPSSARSSGRPPRHRTAGPPPPDRRPPGWRSAGGVPNRSRRRNVPGVRTPRSVGRPSALVPRASALPRAGSSRRPEGRSARPRRCTGRHPQRLRARRRSGHGRPWRPPPKAAPRPPPRGSRFLRGRDREAPVSEVAGGPAFQHEDPSQMTQASPRPQPGRRGRERGRRHRERADDRGGRPHQTGRFRIGLEVERRPPRSPRAPPARARAEPRTPRSRAAAGRPGSSRAEPRTPARPRGPPPAAPTSSTAGRPASEEDPSRAPGPRTRRRGRRHRPAIRSRRLRGSAAWSPPGIRVTRPRSSSATLREWPSLL